LIEDSSTHKDIGRQGKLSWFDEPKQRR